ncbi:hypothetical protein [uncultured Lactobacillus sp.]|nr:hypothetical protein [uncultured Lactobacillus sp.]
MAHTSYEDLGSLADRQLYKDKCNGRGGFAIEYSMILIKKVKKL